MFDAFVVARNKVSNNSAGTLVAALAERGVSVYHCTPQRNPKKSPAYARNFITFGATEVPIWIGRANPDARWVNTARTVELSSDKVQMTQAMVRANVPHVETTQHRIQAEGWLEHGHTVVTRTLTRASQGRGIVLSPPDELPNARMYTKLFTGPRVREYRVYIVGNQAIDITEKRRWSAERRAEAGIDTENPYHQLIRSHDNGWVFARTNTQASASDKEAIKRVAEQAAHAIGMRLGGVDLIASWTDREARTLQDVRVIETNTAINLTGDSTTLSAVADALAREVA